MLAADWAATVLLNKRVLTLVNPMPTNLLVRIISLTCLLLTTVPLTVLGWWELTFAMTWEAFGYICVSAVVTWVVAFNAYYYALRSGRVGVVSPITATDPLFTALFSALFLGTALASLTVLGLLLAVFGVVLITRWTREEEPVLEDSAPAALPGLALPDPRTAAPLPGQESAAGHRSWRAQHVALVVVILAVICSAGWGLSPVIIQAAEESLGGASTTMIIQSQALGLVMLGAIVYMRRIPLTVRPLSRGERRYVTRLIVAAGILEALFSVLFFLVIAELGAVLTALIGGTYPIFAILGGIVFLKEKMSARLAAAAAVTLLGVFVATAARLT